MIGQIVFNGGDQNRHARETATPETFIGDLTEPTLNQIQPGTGRRSEVQMESRMPLEPGFHPRMFVRAVIIHDQMEVESRRSFGIDFLEETDELLVSMAGHTVADHLAIEHTESSKQSRRSMANVIVRHRPAPALLQRKTGLGPVESLDLAFFVQAQNKGPVRWIQVQAHDIAQLLDKVLVSTEFEGIDQMGLQVVLLPDAPDSRFTQILGSGHSPRAPMRRIRRRRMQRGFNHSFDFTRRDFRNTTRPGGVFFQTGHSKSQKTLSPQLHGGTRDPQFASDILVQRSACRHSNDLGPLHKPGREASAMRPCFQGRLFLGGQDDGLRRSAHQALSYAQYLYMSRHL